MTNPSSEVDPTKTAHPSGAVDQPRAEQRLPRPLSVTLLAVGVLIIAILNLIRFQQSIRQWDLLSEVLHFSPLYLAAGGLVWCLAGLLLFWWLWRGKRAAPRFTRLFAVLLALYYWADRILLADRAAVMVNALFMAGVTLLALALIFWVFSRPKVRAFFGERHV